MARRKEPNLEGLNKDKIAGVAREYFIEHGFLNTTMNDIAREVGISKSTLYVYFNNKEAIKNYLSLQAMFHFQENLMEKIRPDSMTIREIFMETCEILVQFKEKYPLGFSLMTEEICVDEDVLKADKVLAQIYDVGEEINQFIFNCFQEYLPHKDERDLLTKEFAIWGSIHGVIRFADNKGKYLARATGISKAGFLKQSFEYLFESIRWK